MASRLNPENQRQVARAIVSVCDESAGIALYLQVFLVNKLLRAATALDDKGRDLKYFGQPYWSDGALRRVYDHISEGNPRLNAGLVHEHAVPCCCFESVVDKLVEQHSLTESKMMDLLRFATAVIVTNEEDKILNKFFKESMPPAFGFRDGEDVFARYRAAGIAVYELDEQVSRNLRHRKLPEGGLDSLLGRPVPTG